MLEKVLSQDTGRDLCFLYLNVLEKEWLRSHKSQIRVRVYWILNFDSFISTEIADSPVNASSFKIAFLC